MFKKYFFLLFPLLGFGQCFDCAKNMGGWNGDAPVGIVKAVDGIYLLKNSGNFNSYAGLDKYDFNCNLIWRKQFNDFEMYIQDLTTDAAGNIYVLYAWTISANAGYGPYLHEGLSMNPGLNLYKFDPNGNVMWHRFMGYGNLYNNFNKIYNYNNLLYVVSSHYGSINIDNQYSFNFPYTDDTRPYISQVDFQGNIIDVKSYGTGREKYLCSEMDSNGNIYMSSYNPHSGTTHADLEKIDANLNPVWSKQLSNNEIYRVTQLYYNADNNKLYTWGSYNNTVDVLGNVFSTNGATNGVFQILLGEFDPTNGNLNRISRFDNNSSLAIPGVGGSTSGNSGYMAHKNNELYIFTSFRDTLVFPNATVTSNTYYSGMYSSEELVLFKVDLSSFTNEFILKSYGVPNLSYAVTDAAGPIMFDNNDLYITAAFSSKPMLFNGATINNNSGNNGSDIMLYKYSTTHSSSTGEIKVTHTCLNDLTSFNLPGNFDTVTWNFDDPASANNSSNSVNPSHQFSATGNYHVTALVTCGTQSQTVVKDVTITNVPTINSILPITECETVSGSGICSTFNTSTINSQLAGSQPNTTIEFRNSGGILLQSPLPNPYTNANVGGDIITARVFNSNNPTCYVETNIQFNTKPKSVLPTAASPQKFCVQQNATINDIVVTGSGIKWYDAPSAGNLLLTTTALQDGLTYYCSQTVGTNCESNRLAVAIQVQSTPMPTGTNQSFCATQNATLNDVVVSGNTIKWYAGLTGSTALPTTTILTDTTSYFATQTINGCESVNRLPINISLIYSLNATNYATFICDAANNGMETVTLSDYNSFLIGNTSGNAFSYYSSQASAENQIVADQLPATVSITSGLNLIFVRIDANNGCHQVVALQLTLVNTPILSLLDEYVICENKRTMINAGSGYDSYAWSTGATSNSIIVTQAGNYSLTVTENHGGVICSLTKNFTVVVSNPPTIISITIVDWTDNQNSITVNTSGLGEYEYSIDGLNFQTSNIFSGLLNGSYTVTVRDRKGCGEASQEVFVLNYPKFFTPNGDGFHDNWYIRFSQLEADFNVKIFDRLGKLIKSINNSGVWDGSFNGKLMPADDYWFNITRQDGRIHKGHFSLIR